MPYPTYDRWKPFIVEVSASVLALCASMILGLLSFSGMFAAWPVVSFACAAFIFAIVIEGEIYLQNIRSALEKLTDFNAYENQLTGLFIQEKLATFDRNRDLFLRREPTIADQKRVLDHNEVLIIAKDGQYKIGFCNQSGAYEEREIPEQHRGFLSHYSKEQYMETPGHHNLVQAILKEIDPALGSRERLEYPFFVKAYVSQCHYVRQSNCYQHTQLANAENQESLTNMSAHLATIDQDVMRQLFYSDASSGTPMPKPVVLSENYGKWRRYPLEMFDFETMAFKSQMSFVKPGMTINDCTPDEYAFLELKNQQFYHHELQTWVTRTEQNSWKNKLATHTMHSRLALVVSAFSGLIMGIGTTYLIMEAMTIVPWLALIPLSIFPPLIAPLALVAGVAYGLLIYNSLTDILLDNPFKKFADRVRAFSQHKMTLKKKLMLVLSALLLIATVFLTICTAGTWLTVFHKTKPIFTWISNIPNLLLNLVIPILIGISILPFSIQSIANTLENLDENASFDAMLSALQAGDWQALFGVFPRTWNEISARIWTRWVPGFLGVTAEEFAAETFGQKSNPYRIVHRLLFEPLRIFIFVGHLISAGATADQMAGVPVWFSFVLNFFFELAEDFDWIFGRTHADNVDTATVLKERFQKTDDHNHDKNLPMRFLKLIFDPILLRAAQWDNTYRPEPEKPDEAPLIGLGSEDNVQKRYEKLQGLTPGVVLDIPAYRKSANFNLFLFKSSALEASVPIDSCCVIAPTSMNV